MCKKVVLLLALLGLCLASPAQATDIVWVSFHAADGTPGSGAAGAGFTTATDKDYTDLLRAEGFTVTRYVTTATPDAALLNAADLVIISRSVASSGYQDAAATRWNQITAPTMILGGYVIRQNRMGFSTGNTIPDTTGDITLTVNDPTHPIFTGIPLTNGTMTNPFAGVVNHPTTGALMRGISIVSDAPNANGTVLATVSSAGGGPAGAMVIGEWPAGVTVTHAGGGGTDVLGGPRLVFLTGSRETDGVNSETAGYYDLHPDGAKMFVNAVRYMTGTLLDPGAASNPSPSDKQEDTPIDVAFSWTAGENAATHDVYFGTTFADVNDATRANPLGVLASQGQIPATFDPPATLAFGQTYYWRVDEWQANGTTMYKGGVWSLTTEPLSYLITDVTVSASLPPVAGTDPNQTINGSGLNTQGQHSTADPDSWSVAPTAGDVVWIQFDFDRVYKINEMHVWNYNFLYEPFLFFSFKDVTVEYTTDANDWVALGQFQLAQAPGTPAYTGQAIDLGGIGAKGIRITALSNYGGQQYGLSEVQFQYIPAHPRQPQPAAGVTGVSVDATLNWRPGREAVTHEVSLGTDPNAVAAGAAVVDVVTTSTFDPGALNLGTTYYWKIDEVNEAATPSVWDGGVWSFTTQEYLSIDDFENYSDDEGTRVFDKWLDGYGVGANGSQVGHNDVPFAEQTIVNSGRQSMPMTYTNTGGVAYSEAELTFASPKNLTTNGADVLSLYHHGNPIGLLQVSDSHIVMNGTGNDIWGTSDQGRFVYKQLTGNGSIVARVESIDNTDGWAKAGVMIRQSLDADSAWAFALVSAANGTHFQARPTAAGTAVSDTPLTLPAEQTAVRAPAWVKLERTGNTFNVYYATDEAGTAWVANPWNPQTITMTGPVYIGVAVTSHDAAEVAQGEFTNIATTGSVTGQWQSASLGVDQLDGNGPDTLYVTVEDSAGKKATIAHPSPAAIGVGSWKQWTIPLSDVSAAGVNTSSVKKLYIGVGDKTKPSRNSEGILYIDDVAYGHAIDAE